MSSSSSTSALSDWEDLRKRARKSESAIYTKLCDYAQAQHATNSLSSSHSSSQRKNSSSDERSKEVEKAKELEKEIEELLGKLSDINDSMGRLLSTNDPSVSNDNNTYTLQRYRSIWHDYTQEFRKTRESIRAAVQRAELLSGGRSAAVRGNTELLLREKTSLQNSLRMTDDVIAQAIEARQSLTTQQAVFHNITKKMGSLGKRFPIINQLTTKITAAKNRDMIVLACVIASCLCFTFYYIMNKN